MKKINVAKTASRGIVAAPVYLYEEADLAPSEAVVSEQEKALEKEKFDKAKEEVLRELESLSAENEIFAAHLEIAGDFTLTENVYEKIDASMNAQKALHMAVEELAEIFAAMDDAYMRERAADIKDIGKRFMAALKGIRLPDLGSLNRGVIVVARDLYPSDTVKMNPEFVLGILTEEGGVTSHVSILAKNLDIPILVGIKGLLTELTDGVIVCMDADLGEVVIDPDEDEQNKYQEKKVAYEARRKHLIALRKTEPVTKSGRRISLCINAGSPEDIRKAMEVGADGVGLFRSELLYMEKDHFPTEEEQFAVYREAAKLMPKELTIRTLDIGGDKTLPYYTFEQEENPFLGWRAIRISLEMKDMFKEQLRAILRASYFGHIRIMFPMIISLEELQEARTLVEACKEELRQKEIPFDEKIEMGMMVETPASVILAEKFAKEADFFSIGTNDLTQYLLAVDRGNKKIAAMYDSFHPAVLAAIRHIIEAGHKEGIKVGMCGEMAGDPKAVPILLEMGLDEFSMSATGIDYVREIILEHP